VISATDDRAIRIADERDIRPVGELLAAAFQEPVAHWLVPDPDSRVSIMPRFFALVAQDAMEAGTVYVYGDYQAAALWFDLTAPSEPAAEPAAPDSRYDNVMGPYADRWTALARIMDSNHPHPAHHYLMLIGVMPQQQGLGIGSLLLHEHHAKVQGTPAYLEATSANSRRLYLRHGYRDQGDPLRLPDGPLLWPMWRPADGRP
jgi:ribosomal protein S18 acetylase RimI-like enzyme